jgi:hypothetical protein
MPAARRWSPPMPEHVQVGAPLLQFAHHVRRVHVAGELARDHQQRGRRTRRTTVRGPHSPRHSALGISYEAPAWMRCVISTASFSASACSPLTTG